MLKRLSLVTLVAAIVSLSAASSRAQRQGFITVEGSSLRAKVENAERQGKGRQTRFWTAYSFDVRPGVAVDAEWRSNGNTTIVNGTSVSVGSKIETRNLGVFVLHEPTGGSPVRVEVFNLDRQREYSGYPVYWLGRADNDESLSYLRSLVETNRTGDSHRNSVVAIALHDDPRVGDILENFVRTSQADSVRSSAVFWLGQVPGHLSFLSDLVRNDQESTKVRKEGAFAIGVGKEQGSMAALETLYAAIDSREVKKQIIFAASVNKDELSGASGNDEGVDFMIKVAESDPDRELRKQALFWLGQKAGKRSLEVLGNVIEKSDDDTEVQKQAVFAISQRKRDEAVPLLIKIAKTHPKAEIRKQAMFWLGQTGDERALEFFKEVLSK